MRVLVACMGWGITLSPRIPPLAQHQWTDLGFSLAPGNLGFEQGQGGNHPPSTVSMHAGHIDSNSSSQLGIAGRTLGLPDNSADNLKHYSRPIRVSRSTNSHSRMQGAHPGPPTVAQELHGPSCAQATPFTSVASDGRQRQGPRPTAIRQRPAQRRRPVPVPQGPGARIPHQAQPHEVLRHSPHGMAQRCSYRPPACNPPGGNITRQSAHRQPPANQDQRARQPPHVSTARIPGHPHQRGGAAQDMQPPEAFPPGSTIPLPPPRGTRTLTNSSPSTPVATPTQVSPEAHPQGKGAAQGRR